MPRYMPTTPPFFMQTMLFTPLSNRREGVEEALGGFLQREPIHTFAYYFRKSQRKKAEEKME